MNYLAHLYLSYNEEDILIGNFIADFIRNSQVVSYSPEVQAGIQLHRMIDSFTDTHVEVRKGVRRLSNTQGKYAPVVIDILYDYILAKNWDLYHDVSLEDFSQRVYEVLSRRNSDLPERLRSRILAMVEGDFISGYNSLEGLRYVLGRMDRRTKFPSKFQESADQLMQEYDMFNEEFHSFFPSVIELAQTFLKDNAGSNLRSEKRE